MTSSNNLPENYIVYSDEHYKDTPDFKEFVQKVGHASSGGIGPERQFYYLFPKGLFPKFDHSKHNCGKNVKDLQKQWNAENWPIYSIEEWRELYTQKSEHYEIF